MIRLFLVIAFPLLLGSRCTVSADGCWVDDREFLRWGAPGQGQVEGPVVPRGEVWRVRAAGVFGDNGPAEYMLQLERPVWSQDGACCFKIPVARSPGVVSGTPYLALDRELELREGEALSARVNGLGAGRRIGLTMVYDASPEACF